MLINNLRTRLVKEIHVLLSSLEQEGTISWAEIQKVNFENISLGQPKNKAFGDLTINAAMVLAPVFKKNPMHIAEILKERILEKWEEPVDISIAAPGFINFFIDPKFLTGQLSGILKKMEAYGLNTGGNGVKIQLEYVSANPTGNLHIGHGRWAALGDSLSNIYAANGFDVWREYYVNDYGSQIKKFAICMASLYLRYFNKIMPYPEDGYPEEIIKTVVEEIFLRDGKKYFKGSQTEIINDSEIINGAGPGKSGTADDAAVMDLSNGPEENPDGKSADEAYGINIDLLGKEGVRIMLLRIEKTLASMGVCFDEWFCESSLYEGANFENSLDLLKKKEIVYEKENALWFKAEQFGDEKDRVIIRTGGEPTYFASDIMYLINKAARGFTRLIYILGADHHGYIKRLHAIGKATGFGDKNIEVVIGQLVRLVKKGETVRMSKRKGKVYNLDDLVGEVGSDAVRFFFSANSFDTPMDFDLDLAKQKSNKNPVYYVQYAHARIASVIEKAIRLQIRGELKADKKEIDLEIFDLIADLQLSNGVADSAKGVAATCDKEVTADGGKARTKAIVPDSEKAGTKITAAEGSEFSMTKDNYEAIFNKLVSQLDFSTLVLKNFDEIELAKILLFYPDIVYDACKNNAPYFINQYLYRLASQFHYFYNHHRIIDGGRLNVNRLKLVMAVKVVLTNALNLLKITAPVKM
jgi:arginyl-tRNA synthetase